MTAKPCMFLTRLFLTVTLGSGYIFVNADDKDLYENRIRPVMAKRCFECHNTGNVKGGVNLDNYKEVGRVVNDGRRWLRVLEMIRSREMPPSTKPSLPEDEYNLLVDGLDKILQNSLQVETPGQIVIRRLSHTEYKYTIKDLLGVDFEARDYFPSDGSGGGGFDNQSRALFITPLKFERYYDAADIIIGQLYEDEALWKNVVPDPYEPSWWNMLSDWVRSLFSDDFEPSNPPDAAAEKVLYPLATKAYRRFLKTEEKEKLLSMFMDVYNAKDSVDNPRRFDESLQQTFKMVLVSPNFLYRAEEEPEKAGAYPLSNFELASRLSYFFWSSMPDKELFDLAYLGLLQDTVVLERQVKRMLADPKAKRFAESFSSQWLGIAKLIEKGPVVDQEKYPDFDMETRQLLYDEAVEYFYHALTEEKNLLKLVNSNYTFLNEKLADYYGIEGVKGTEFRKTELSDPNRGGILGMGSVLTVTSLPLRTSPVLRGKYVLEQILGTPPPPPPMNVAELTEDQGALSELGLRKLLEVHRKDPACFGCHQKLDPLGLGLENFDAIGRWRESYGETSIDPSGELADGRPFSGPAELKEILVEDKAKVARNFATKMLSYALGRSVLFTDEPILRRLEDCLMNNNFNPEIFLTELVKSYSFRMKLNDFRARIGEV